MHSPLSRRRLLHWLFGAAAGASTARSADELLPAAFPDPAKLPDFADSQKPLSEEDDAFLDELERANLLFFLEQSHEKTGLVKDRHNVRQGDDHKVASIAATGFGLTAMCIGHERKILRFTEATERVITTLRFLAATMPHHRGFFYHWADVSTGERIWDAEVSSIDTAILLCGVLTCRQHFHHREIRRLSTAIFDRVDWKWLSEDTSLLPHGWTPELGFLRYRWDYYSELMMMYLLGLGSTTHPLPVQAWHAWKRTTFEYDGLRYVGSYAPLFVHQYSQAWFDFRGKRDRYADYFQNSVVATEVHRRFCMELSDQFPYYSNDLWGITASDSKNGYVVWGGPPEMGPIDGTVVPSAAGGSLPFRPTDTLRVLKYIKAQYGESTWCRYGFINAFNPMTSWFDTDVVGIDIGITMLMAENLRTGFIWKTFMKNPEVQRALSRAGFESSTYP
jgi:hypothetical protein